MVDAARSRGAAARCEREMRKGQPSSSRARTHDRRCAVGSRRGLARRKAREPSLGSAGPRMPRARSKGRARAYVVARCSASSRKGGQRANVDVEQTSPHVAVEDSASRSQCPCIVVLQKSSGRLRAQRNAPSAACGLNAHTRQEAGGREPSHERDPERASERAGRGEGKTLHRSAAILIT